MYTYLKTLLFELFEQRRVKALFYSNQAYRVKDEALRRAYRGLSPFHICRDYLISKGETNPYQYGETPLTTLCHISKAFAIHSDETVIELGAGRGRAALFLAEWVGCRVIALECIPLFVRLMVPSVRIEVIQGEMRHAPFKKATTVFLYGTMLSEEEILELADLIPSGVQVITVSYPLSDYDQRYQTKKSTTGAFPWGKTEVYLNERVV